MPTAEQKSESWIKKTRDATAAVNKKMNTSVLRDTRRRETVRATACAVLHIVAGHTKNGNPRRLLLVVHPRAGYVAAVDEGLIGIYAALAGELGKQVQTILTEPGDARVAGRLDVKPSCYRELLRYYGPDGEHRKNIVP